MVKKFVTKETYEKVFNRDRGRCRLCGTTQTLQLHHIHGRGLNLTNNVNNCIKVDILVYLSFKYKN